MPVFVASAERRFSKFKLIKAYRQFAMNQDILSELTIISTENAIGRSLNYPQLKITSLASG